MLPVVGDHNAMLVLKRKMYLNCIAYETKIKQENGLSISANPIISSLLTVFKQPQNLYTYISPMECTEI